MDLKETITVAEAVVAGADPELISVAVKLKEQIDKALHVLEEHGGRLPPHEMVALPQEMSEMLGTLTEEKSRTMQNNIMRLAMMLNPA